MTYKTSEIHKTLKTVREQTFKREDVVYAREHRYSSDSKKELLGIRPTLLCILEERGLLIESSSGYALTPWGSSVLKEFEEAKEKYGSENIEIIPANIEGKITFNVKVNPKVELKIKKEIQTSQAIHETPKEYRERKEKMIEFLQELKNENKPIRNVEEKQNSLIVKTGIKYYRTIEERKKLDEIAKDVGMTVDSNNGIYDRNYVFTSPEKVSVTLVSKKRGKGFKTCKPLEIKIGFEEPTEPAEKLIASLFEKFKSL